MASRSRCALEQRRIAHDTELRMSNGPTVPDQHSAADIAKEVIAELEQAEAAQPEAPKEEPKAEQPEAKPEEQKETPKEEPKAEPVERKSRFVPVQKANAWRHEANEAKARAAELERQVAELRAAQEQAKANDLDAVAKEIAGDEASPEVVKRILEAAKKVATPEPNEDLRSVIALKQKLEEQAEEVGFQKELSQTLSRFPELKGHEVELRELAYAEGNEKVPMELLAYKLRDELNLNPAPPSAEGKASQARAEAEPDYANLSEKEIAAMSDDELDRYIAWQKKAVHKRTGVRL